MATNFYKKLGVFDLKVEDFVPFKSIAQEGWMIRFFVTFAVWMVFGNWVYDEVSLSFPQARPVIDETLKRVAIPTHDQWDRETMLGAVNMVGEALQRVSLAFPELDKVEQQLGESVALRIPSLEKEGAADERSGLTKAYDRF